MARGFLIIGKGFFNNWQGIFFLIKNGEEFVIKNGEEFCNYKWRGIFN